MSKPTPREITPCYSARTAPTACPLSFSTPAKSAGSVYRQNANPNSQVILSLAPSAAHAQSKSGKICVWAESEDLGVLIPNQPGGSVNSISGSEVSLIQQMIMAELRTDKTNNVLASCPQTGDNIVPGVVIGQFLGGYVASVSVNVQGGKDGPLYVSSSVVAAMTDKLLASDIAQIYESVKFRVLTGTTK